MLDWISKLFSSADKPISPPPFVPQSLPDDATAEQHAANGKAQLAAGNAEAAISHYRAAVSAKPGDASLCLNLGFALKEAGHHDAAQISLEQALAIDPQLSDAHYLLGALMLMRNAAALTISHWRTALTLAPDFEIVYLELCRLLQDQGDVIGAQALLLQGQDYLPQSADLPHLLGNIQFEVEQFAQAEASFERALAHHPERIDIRANLGLARMRQEKWEPALDTLRLVVTAAPSEAGIFNFIGNACMALGRFDDAAQAYQSAIAIDGQNSGFQQNLGHALQAQNKFEAARAQFQRAVDLAQDHVSPYLALCRVLQQFKLEEAIEAYHGSLQRFPGNTDLLIGCGTALHAAGRFSEAVSYFERARQLAPTNPDAHYNLGVALYALGHNDEAIACYQTTLALVPHHADALFNLAHALHAGKYPERAIATYRTLLAIAPLRLDAMINLGALLHANDKFEEAIACYQNVLLLKPNDINALVNLGTVLQEQGNMAEAESAFRAALTADPNSIEAHINLSNLLYSIGKLEQAIAASDAALSRDPQHPAAHLAKALALMARGDLEEGWREYEYRWKYVDADPKPSFYEPEWDGHADVHGKTVLIYAEQGLGDTLQFIRYATLVAQRGARVHVLAPRPLQALLRSCPGVAQVFTPDDVLAPFDLHCAMMSLPFLFGTVLDTIPASAPYLKSSPAKQALWRERLEGQSNLGGAPSPLRVGLTWAGNPRKDQRSAHAVDRMRSMQFCQWQPLLDVAGVEFFSLQLGEDAVAQLNGSARVIDFTAELHDFEDTAALVANLDLVISVDTSVVHMTGAIGKPVWVLNRYNSCWRWLTQRHDSPWYPGARLFRQPSLGDWDSVIANVAKALADLVHSPR